MLNTLLFDLDGTLLSVDTDHFVDSYLRLLALKLQELVDPKKFIDSLLEATYVMIHHQKPTKTNKEVFWETFFPMVPCNPEKLAEVLDEFYEVDFPKLSYISPDNSIPADILKTALEKGYEIVIATNPIFPESAVQDRLRWINAKAFPYKLITTYENMHFSKPYKEYYLEILDKIQRRPQDCMMIGNDVEEDMVAGDLGMKTYLVTDYLINRKSLDKKPDHTGTLMELRDYINNLEEVM